MLNCACCCPPQGRELLPRNKGFRTRSHSRCCPPQGRELLHLGNVRDNYPDSLLSPAGARAVTIKETNNHVLYRLLSPAGARAVTRRVVYYLGDVALLSPAGARAVTAGACACGVRRYVAVPRRGASCYIIKNSIKRFYRCCCPPQGREVLLYCYYNTRFAPNQPLLHILCRSVSKPSSIATGCKTQRHKL